MDDSGRQCRYDYFGEFSSQEDISSRPKPVDEPSSSQSHNSYNAGEAASIIEDSIMNFISEYFQGDVNEDFTSVYELSLNSSATSERNNESQGAENAFLDSSSNASIEMFTSPESSLNTSNNSSTETEGIQDYTNPRKSISYEIRFMNLKDTEGKVKIQIVPKLKQVENHREIPRPIASLQTKTLDINANKNLESENALLHQRVQDLERKLNCVEMESERVVSELTRIIERKNETISQLELQIAGIRFINES